jgi:hypothetical protein
VDSPSFVSPPNLDGVDHPTRSSTLGGIQFLPTYTMLPIYLDPRTHTSAVILLAFVLAAGFLLVILSCALWNNWLPILVGTSLSIPMYDIVDLNHSSYVRHGTTAEFDLFKMRTSRRLLRD